MSFGKFKAKVIHKGQIKPVVKCSKCFEVGHYIHACTNDWMCTQCNKPGHKRGNCPLIDDQSSEEEDTLSNPTDDDNDDETDKQTHPEESTNQEEAERAPRAQTCGDGKSTPRRKSKAKKRETRDTKEKNKAQQLLDKFVQHTKPQDTPTGKTKQTKYEHSPPTPDDSCTKKKRN